MTVRSRFPLLRFHPQDEALPRWWGVAWVDWRRCGIWIAPIPLNWILAGGRWCWASLKVPPDRLLHNPRQAYLQGRHDGAMARQSPSALSEATRRAWNEGYRAGRQAHLGMAPESRSYPDPKAEDRQR